MTTQRKVAVLFGTRPEAIKLSPVMSAMRAVGMPFDAVTTGQHRELAADILPLFGITAAYDLAIMRHGQSLDYVLSAAVRSVGEYLDRERVAAVVVQGDTSSTLAAALSGFHHRLPVAHVEAGLRTHDLSVPFPEEMNRRLTSVVAHWHFAPTKAAADNLAREGFVDRVVVTGNTIVDAVRLILDARPTLPARMQKFLGHSRYVVATAHRRESWGEGIARIAQAVRAVIDEHRDMRAIFVCHPNPHARQPVRDALEGHPRIQVVEAIPYPHFLMLLSDAALAITDSGGVQEEGPTLGVPVIVTRAVTERPEGVEAGAVRIAGTDVDRIVACAAEMLSNPDLRFRTMEIGRSLYGDGHAAERIVRTLVEEASA